MENILEGPRSGESWEIYYQRKAHELAAKVAELECLTQGIDWEQWYDCSEILSSQQSWKEMAHRYRAALESLHQIEGLGIRAQTIINRAIKP